MGFPLPVVSSREGRDLLDAQMFDPLENVNNTMVRVNTNHVSAD